VVQRKEIFTIEGIDYMVMSRYAYTNKTQKGEIGS
jgi:hypothetical protein